ncbi:MAG: TetR/AcrR family transcriptional regulator [Candidatus Cloacimonetes bacterium]|nr:TetR/AcrR family transcriptional regulator [Candidatus Cloacimonadota bacterium]
MKKQGRPLDSKNSNVKDKLISAALDCFSEKSFETVSIRELSKKAKVNSAMINYYFESKLGLYQEMLRKIMAPMYEELEILKSITDDDDPFKLHLETVSKIISNDPKFIKIMIFGLANTGSPFHQFLTENFIVRIRDIFFPIILKKIETGEFREDLEPRYVFQSMISLMLHPHMMYDWAGDIFGTEDRSVFNKKVLSHSYSIFISGCRVQESK